MIEGKIGLLYFATFGISYRVTVPRISSACQIIEKLYKSLFLKERGLRLFESSASFC